MTLEVSSLGGLVAAGPTRHEQMAAAWLAGYRVEKTRVAYAHALGVWFDFCARNSVEPLLAIRAHVDLFMRQLEAQGYADRTVASRISAVSAFYTYLVDEDVLRRSPLRGVKRPKVDRKSPTGWLTRPQVHDLLVGAQGISPMAHALVAILAFNGLRIAEACSLDVTSLETIGFYPRLRFIRKGGAEGLAALARPTEAAVHRAIGDRVEGPLLLTSTGSRMNQQAAQRLLDVASLSIRGEHPRVHPHLLRHTWTTIALTAGCSQEQVRNDGGWSDGRMVSYYGGHGLDDPARSSTHAVASLILGVG